MTNYGTIPTSSSPTVNLEYISRAKDRLKAGFSTRRPWRLMVTPLRSLCLPSGLADAFLRARVNATFFRVNYAVCALVILFLSLLWHPVSLIVLSVMVALWIFLYFLRDDPLVVFGRTIDDRAVLAVLAVLTVGLLLLTGATLNVLVAVLVAAVLILVHAVLRRTEDLFVDEESAGLMTGGASSS